MKFLSDIEVEEGLKDSDGNLGSNGQILSSTGSGTDWVAGGSGGGIQDSTTEPIANQYIAVGTAANTIGGQSKFIWTPQLGLQVGNASDTQGNIITINRPSGVPGKFIIKQGSTTEFSIVTGGSTTISTNTNNLFLTDDSTAKVGVGDTSPSSKLSVAGGIQMANDGDAASQAKAGTLKYYNDSGASYLQICMQTGNTGLNDYEWVTIIKYDW
jgi:hypothetical protein